MFRAQEPETGPPLSWRLSYTSSLKNVNNIPGSSSLVNHPTTTASTTTASGSSSPLRFRDLRGLEPGMANREDLSTFGRFLLCFV
jgi:hypothetical protein